MTNRSKDKGAAAERELCKLLSAAFDAPFIRSANSGAFLGGKNAHRRASLTVGQRAGGKADIVPPDHLSRLVVESKWYAEFAYHGLLAGPVAILDEWLQQTADAADSGDLPVTCFRANRRAWSVAFPLVDAFAMDIVVANHLVYVTGAGEKFMVTDLAAFLEKNRKAIEERCG